MKLTVGSQPITKTQVIVISSGIIAGVVIGSVLDKTYLKEEQTTYKIDKSNYFDYNTLPTSLTESEIDFINSNPEIIENIYTIKDDDKIIFYRITIKNKDYIIDINTAEKIGIHSKNKQYKKELAN